MYFKHNATNRIDTLLSKEDLTLYELLDEDDIIQECRARNMKLMEFLQQPKILDELVTLTTVEPSADLDEKIRFKYPNIASEILTCDLTTLNEKLAGDPMLMEKLYSFLYQDAPLNPLLASFFCKTMCVLIVGNDEQNWLSNQYTSLKVGEFLQSKENFSDLLLKHIGTSAIMDLVLKILTAVGTKGAKETTVLWLLKENFIHSAVKLLGPEIDTDRHHNVAQLLCDLMESLKSEEAFDDLMISKIFLSEELVTLVCKTILTPEKCESSIVSGIKVLLSLLDFFMKSDTPLPHEDELTELSGTIQPFTKAILPCLPDFHDLLVNPPMKPPVRTTVCVLDPPLGCSRLYVAKLVSALIDTKLPELITAITNNGSVETLLSLFFSYTWNNFLHTQVTQCIIAALRPYENLANGDGKDYDWTICSNLFVKCKLLERILDAWRKNENIQKGGGIRQGYMGHLINISQEIAYKYAKNPMSESFLKENVEQETIVEWEKFIAEELDVAVRTQNILLGGVVPDTQPSETREEYMDQSVFKEPDMFTSKMNDCDDSENWMTKEWTLSDYTGSKDLDFSFGDSDFKEQSAHFEHICNQTANSFPNLEDIIIDSDKPIVQKQSFGMFGSSSDEEEQEENSGLTGPLADTVNPWGENSQQSSHGPFGISSDNWADFDSFANNFTSMLDCFGKSGNELCTSPTNFDISADGVGDTNLVEVVGKLAELGFENEDENASSGDSAPEAIVEKSETTEEPDKRKTKLYSEALSEPCAEKENVLKDSEKSSDKETPTCAETTEVSQPIVENQLQSETGENPPST